MMNKNIKKALLFTSLTFLSNYLLVFLYFVRLRKWVMPNSFIVSGIYMFVPMLVAIIIQKLIYRESLRTLGLSWQLNKWFLIAWLLPIVIVFATLGTSLLFRGVEYSPGMTRVLEQLKSVVTPEELNQIYQSLAAVPIYAFILINVLQALIAGVTINAVFGFGEELGWRGLLQTELNFMGFWKSSLLRVANAS